MSKQQQMNAEEERSHYAHVVEGGIKAAGTGLAVFGLAAFGASRGRMQIWTHTTVPIRAAMGTIVTLGSFAFGADKASTAWIHENTAKRGQGKAEEDAERSLGLGGSDRRALLAQLGTRDRAIEWFKENKWSAVGGAWLLGMGGSWAMISRQPMPFRQQIVQVRMYAQGITVAALFAAIAISSIHTGADASLERQAEENQVREAAVYRYKKGSDAYKSHKAAQQHHLERQQPKLPDTDKRDDPAYNATEGSKKREGVSKGEPEDK